MRVNLKSPQEILSVNVVPRPGEVTDLDLIRTAMADWRVEFSPCGQVSGTLAQPEQAHPFP